MSTTTAPAGAGELLRQAIETFQSAVKSGMRLQEESTRRFTEMLRGSNSPLDWQKMTQKAMGEALVTTQRSIDEAIRMMNQNTKTAMGMIHRALEARPESEEMASEGQELWETVLGAMRSSSEAILKTNAQVLQSWAEFARKISNSGAEAMQRGSEAAQRSAEAAQAGVEDVVQRMSPRNHRGGVRRKRGRAKR